MGKPIFDIEPLELEVSSEFRIYLPKSVREIANINRGDLLRVIVQDGNIILKPLTSQSLVSCDICHQVRMGRVIITEKICLECALK